MTSWARSFLAWALLGIAPALLEAHAQRAEAPEASVKAAFLYKFAGYVEWPPSAFVSADAPFVIGVMGTDEIAADLGRIAAGRAIGGHAVVVKRLRENDSPKGVHLLFVGKSDAPRLASILRAAQQQGVLTVTESEGGLEMGSAINFVTSQDRIGFEVSLDSADKSGHRISSRMLAVARRVVPKT
jgi:hypothetical protein